MRQAFGVSELVDRDFVELFELFGFIQTKTRRDTRFSGTESQSHNAPILVFSFGRRDVFVGKPNHELVNWRASFEKANDRIGTMSVFGRVPTVAWQIDFGQDFYVGIDFRDFLLDLKRV